MEFGSLLRRVRLARDFDQAALGAAVGVSHATISQWERGHRLPDVEQLVALCRVLHVSADVLVGRSPFHLDPVPPEPRPLERRGAWHEVAVDLWEHDDHLCSIVKAIEHSDSGTAEVWQVWADGKPRWTYPRLADAMRAATNEGHLYPRHRVEPG